MPQKKRILFFLITAVIFLLLLAAILAYSSFSNKENNYVIQNKYYGFSLKTPKDWRAEENTNYSEETISKILDDCRINKLNDADPHQIGAFRFLNGAAFLEVVVSCAPDSARTAEVYSNTKIGGEKAVEGIIAGPDGSDSVKYFSFSHSGFDYKINEHGYDQAFNKIISSFNFVK